MLSTSRTSVLAAHLNFQPNFPQLSAFRTRSVLPLYVSRQQSMFSLTVYLILRGSLGVEVAKERLTYLDHQPQQSLWRPSSMADIEVAVRTRCIVHLRAHLLSPLSQGFETLLQEVVTAKRLSNSKVETLSEMALKLVKVRSMIWSMLALADTLWTIANSACSLGFDICFPSHRTHSLRIA